MSQLSERVAATRATLERIARDFSPAVFASSLAAEDMVLTDMILKARLPIGIFSLETGRLHPETLAVLDQVKQVYGYDIELYRPQPEAVEAYVAHKGLNAFYDSVELRRECCHVRKVEPLGRALAGKRAWITGQRRAQSTTRAELPVQEDDAAHNMVKFNPLADWSEVEVWDYLRANDVPYNKLL
jgi:phosphoadenosine phosphosulfate reductase